MTKTKAKVVGIVRGVSKKGNAYTMLHVNKPPIESMIKSGSVGNLAVSYFVDDGLLPKVTNDLINKEVILSTLYVNKQDILCDVEAV